MRTLILAVLGLITWTCHAATITIQVDADLLKDSAGNAMPTNGLVVLVASTLDTNFNAPTAGSFVSGDDIILAKFDLRSSGVNGVLIDVASSLTLTGNWTPGDPLAIYWYPTLTLNSPAPTAGIPYGFYTTNAPPAQDGSDPWTTPQAPANIDLRFLTTDADPNGHLPGHSASSLGLASYTVGTGTLAAPTLGVSLLGGGTVGINLTGAANANYALQYVNALLSTNNNWLTLSNGKTDGTGKVTFTDTLGTSSRFYRSQALP